MNIHSMWISFKTHDPKEMFSGAKKIFPPLTNHFFSCDNIFFLLQEKHSCAKKTKSYGKKKIVSALYEKKIGIRKHF